MHCFFIATTKKKEGALHTDRPIFEFPNHTAEFPNQWTGMVKEFCKRAPQKSYLLSAEGICGKHKAPSISRFCAVNKRPLLDFKGPRGGFLEILAHK